MLYFFTSNKYTRYSIMRENLTEDKKDKILKDIFHDQGAELRIFRVESLLENGEADTFLNACKKLKREEDTVNATVFNATKYDSKSFFGTRNRT